MQYAICFWVCLCADQKAQLIIRYKLTDHVLKKMVSEEHICVLGKTISWKEVGKHLLTDGDKLQSIENDHEKVEKGQVMLEEWQETLGDGATYDKLIEAMVNAEKMKEACTVCKMIKPGE